jgi:hypothetical protein
MQPNANGHTKTNEQGEQEKERLTALLQSSRQATLDALRGLDDWAVVHPETGWRVMDVLGHLAAWEHEVFAAIQAFTENDEYTIPNFDEQRYNTEAYQRRRALDPAQIRIDWAMVRGEIRLAVRDMTPDQLQATMRYPSGRRGTAAALLQEIIDHEEEHVRDILAALEGKQEDK